MVCVPTVGCKVEARCIVFVRMRTTAKHQANSNSRNERTVDPKVGDPVAGGFVEISTVGDIVASLPFGSIVPEGVGGNEFSKINVTGGFVAAIGLKVGNASVGGRVSTLKASVGGSVSFPSVGEGVVGFQTKTGLAEGAGVGRLVEGAGVMGASVGSLWWGSR